MAATSTLSETMTATTKHVERADHLTVDAEEVVPVKQLLRWQDDGGAIVPGAPLPG